MIYRFDYGDYYPANHTNGLPFIQMLPTTDPSTMWDEFSTERQAMLAELPAELSPEEVVKYDQQQAARSSNSTTGSGNTQQLGVAGASSGDDNEDEKGGSWYSKNGTLVIALLGANLLVGVAIFAVTLTMCVRGVKGKAGPGRYAPVRFKEVDDHERGAMKYSD